MKSKSILQRKPELIVVALLAAFILSGTAAADINPSMISVDKIGELIYNEAVSLFWLVVAIMIVVGAILIAINTPESKAWGHRIVKGCLVAAILFFVLPWLINEVQNVSTVGNNTTST
jgi:uncharacterized BrkB/YihY/UPF0761 family membrane protein